MIVGIGIDIVAVARLDDRLPTVDGLIEDLFTEQELAYCRRKAHASECLAARFAAKEAFLKAVGAGLNEGLLFRQIEIVNDEHGNPALRLSGKAEEAAQRRKVRRSHLSLSHVSTHAVAVVVLED